MAQLGERSSVGNQPRLQHLDRNTYRCAPCQSGMGSPRLLLCRFAPLSQQCKPMRVAVAINYNRYRVSALRLRLPDRQVNLAGIA